MISMATSHPNGDSFYAAVPLAPPDSAATIELDNDLVLLKLHSPLMTSMVVLNRDEARAIAMNMIDATQIDRAEE
jgi:hypothetical protein